MITIRPVIHGQERLMADSLVRELYGAHHIERHKSGAPYLVCSDGLSMDVRISISHTGSYIALMGSSAPCGVDIEFVERAVEHLASRFASRQEIELCSTIFAVNPALLVWCAKEALYKVLGREGVDFRRDLCIVACGDGGRLTARGFDEIIELEWYVCLPANLLVVSTTV